jgi:phosphoribosylformylglycinamidine (FGAM) synthase-like amidotransferase family enzyme
MRLRLLPPPPDEAGSAVARELARRAGGAPQSDGPETLVVLHAALAPDDTARLQAHAARGGAVLGLGPGAQALFTAGLLPGRLEAQTPVEVRATWVRIEGRPTVFTAALPAGRVLALGPTRVDVRLVHESPGVLVREGRAVLRYCDAAAGLSDAANPGGAPAHIAAVASEPGHVLALLPTPERPGVWLEQLLAAASLATRGNPPTPGVVV